MKIVHLCFNFDYHRGYSYQENLLAKYHKKMGYDVTILSSGAHNLIDGEYVKLLPDECFEDNGVIVKAIGQKKAIIPQISSILRKYDDTYGKLELEQPDIIFVHGVSFWDTHVVARYLKNHPSVKCYCDNHGDYYNSAHGWVSKVIFHGILWKHGVQTIMPYVQKFYGVTPWRCDFLKRMYGVKDSLVKYLPLGVDDESIPADRIATRKAVQDRMDIPEGSFIISAGGRIDKTKNIQHLLSAVQKIANDTLYVIVYGSIDDESKQIFNALHLDDHVKFVGWSNAEQVMEYMVTSDLCVFPGTHSTLWEQAVGVGIPCIFNDWGEGMHHLNVCGNAMFVKGDDVETLSVKIASLIFTDAFDQMKSAASQASQQFLYSEIAKKAIDK